jgi:hypothetical protein
MHGEQSQIDGAILYPKFLLDELSVVADREFRTSAGFFLFVNTLCASAYPFQPASKLAI